MRAPRDYCPKCDATVDVREISKCWGTEWRCLVCNTMTDQDYDDRDNDPEED